MHRLAPLIGLLALLAMAAPASAATRTETFRFGPIVISGYQVKQDITLSVPKPSTDAWISKMEVDVVDADGTPVPIQRLMLHHIVFGNLGQELGDKRDNTCNSITSFDSRVSVPAWIERFYAAGEERAVMDLPQGYGYSSRGADKWGMVWMMMNHRPVEDSAFIQYTVTYETEPQTEVTPYWLDARNCSADPVYDVPGGRRAGNHVERVTWTPPKSGRVVGGGGHMHGGGKALRVAEPGCENRTLAVSRPRWGAPDHPFYNVKPVLHEPGPIAMSAFRSARGIPVSAGRPLVLESIYDGTLPHTRVMGIYMLYLAPGDVGLCEAIPADVETVMPPGTGRTETPVVKVPLTGLDAQGTAITISRPPGRTLKLRRGPARVTTNGLSFSRPNLSVPRGAKVTWTFAGDRLHNITLASGPRGFSSPNLTGGAEFTKRLNVPGTYRLFCALHPVDMTQRVIVR